MTAQGVQGLDFPLVRNAGTAGQRESRGILDMERGIRVRPAQKSEFYVLCEPQRCANPLLRRPILELQVEEKKQSFLEAKSKEQGLSQSSGSVVSDSVRPRGRQHPRPPCPSPTPGAYSNPTISSSVIPFSSCLQSFPTSGSFPVSQFFISGGQSIGASASASVLPMNIQD